MGPNFFGGGRLPRWERIIAQHILLEILYASGKLKDSLPRLVEHFDFLGGQS